MCGPSIRKTCTRIRIIRTRNLRKRISLLARISCDGGHGTVPFANHYYHYHYHYHYYYYYYYHYYYHYYYYYYYCHYYYYHYYCYYYYYYYYYYHHYYYYYCFYHLLGIMGILRRCASRARIKW